MFDRLQHGEEKFVLNVLDLKRIDLATEEDRRYELDCWARMFKAGTWEELRMIAEKNKYMSEAAMAMYELNADEIIRQQCMAREEYNRYEKMMARKLAEADEQLAEARKDAAEAKNRQSKSTEMLLKLRGSLSKNAAIMRRK